MWTASTAKRGRGVDTDMWGPQGKVAGSHWLPRRGHVLSRLIPFTCPQRKGTEREEEKGVRKGVRERARQRSRGRA